jgi:hypothetical protein
MGTCLSTVLPRCVLGTPREGSPKGRTPLSGDFNNKELPELPGGAVNGEEPPDSANSKYLPDVVHSKPLPNGIRRKHLPDEEHNERVPDDAQSKHLPDDVHHKTNDVETERRALLVGITYTSSSNTWSQLDGPHGDVDQYQDLLISA